jgi:hypothetical protein
MGTLIAALGAFVLAGLPLLLIPSERWPANFWPYFQAGVLVLSAYIAVQSLLALRARKAELPSATPPAPVAQPAPAVPAEAPQAGEALMLLSLLQEKGRFVDYLMEDITGYNDAQVAAASRVVHQGCSAVLGEYLAISPTHAGNEGDRITIDKSADRTQYRLIGKVHGEPPYNGVVIHRGWKTRKLALPRFTRRVDPAGENIIAPVEVEVR